VTVEFSEAAIIVRASASERTVVAVVECAQKSVKLADPCGLM
jgi:hypothetical protein